MIKVRRNLERLRPSARKRKATVPICCPACGRADRLVRMALAGGSDEIRAVYCCDGPRCRTTLRVVVGIGLAPRISVEDVSGELNVAVLRYGPEGAAQRLVATDSE